jgi:hypothetical protein
VAAVDLCGGAVTRRPTTNATLSEPGRKSRAGQVGSLAQIPRPLPTPEPAAAGRNRRRGAEGRRGARARLTDRDDGHASDRTEKNPRPGRWVNSRRPMPDKLLKSDRVTLAEWMAWGARNSSSRA